MEFLDLCEGFGFCNGSGSFITDSIMAKVEEYKPAQHFGCSYGFDSLITDFVVLKVEMGELG